MDTKKEWFCNIMDSPVNLQNNVINKNGTMYPAMSIWERSVATHTTYREL